MDDNLNSLFIALRKYFDYFRAYSSGMPFPMPQGMPMMSVTPMICEEELVGLLTWLQLATTLAQKNPEARRHIYEDRSWNVVENICGLLTCSIPLPLKRDLFKFLAALALDETAAVNIWNGVLREGICSQLPNGKLSGVQQDLEEQECALKVYDCSQGYLCLMQELFRHKTRPIAIQMGPHLQFIVKSIICQFASRSYKDPTQMWELVKLGLDCLNELLKMFYVTQMTVRNKSSEIQLLGQLLNDSPLSRSVITVIAEGISEEREKWPKDPVRDDAAFSAIRLLYTALSHRSAMVDAIRAVESNLIVSSLESIMFTAVTTKGNVNCLSLLLLYVIEAETFGKHVFYVLKILREVSAQRPSLQLHIVQTAYANRNSLMDSFFRLTSVFSSEVDISQTDLVPSDIEHCSPARIRGEISRHLLEVCTDAVDSDPTTHNLAYFLLGFDLRSINDMDVDLPDRSNDGLRNIMELVSILCSSDQPFQVPFSGLYEPALRLLLKLASFGAANSSAVIRNMRSHSDLIYKLATSAVFRKFDSTNSCQRIRADCDAASTFMILQKSIQAIVLELIALELSSLLRMGHMEQPKKYIVALLSTPTDDGNDGPRNFTDSFATSVEGGSSTRALLWSLLDQSRMDIEELSLPTCNKFNKEKIDELLSLCIRKNSCNVEIFDIEYLHLLLNTEINSILNKEIGVIRTEGYEILDFCAHHNARSLLEGACIHLLSGWLSVVNVLSLHVPLPFIDPEHHQCFLVDALFLLKDYSFYVDTSVELSGAISNCIFRLVRAICKILEFNRLTRSQMRQTLFPIIHLLLECLVMPGYSKCVRFKIDMYGGILSIFDACSRVDDNEAKASNPPSRNESTNLSVLMDEDRNRKAMWAHIFESITVDVVSTIASDITFAPLSLKIVATSCLSDIIREDIIQSQRVAQQFVYSGSMRCVMDSLSRVVTDFRSEKKPNAEKKEKQLLLIKALFSLFVRLAATEVGWTAIVSGNILQQLLRGTEGDSSKTITESSPESIMRQLLSTMTKL